MSIFWKNIKSITAQGDMGNDYTFTVGRHDVTAIEYEEEDMGDCVDAWFIVKHKNKSVHYYNRAPL